MVPPGEPPTRTRTWACGAGAGGRHPAWLRQHGHARGQQPGIGHAQPRRQARRPVRGQMPGQAAVQPERLPLTAGRVGAGPARDPGIPVIPADLRRSGITTGGVGEQMPRHPVPHLIGLMQRQRLGQMMQQMPRAVQMRPGGGLQPRPRQPQLLTPPARILRPAVFPRPIRRHPISGIVLQRPLQPPRRPEQSLQPGPDLRITAIQRQPDHRHRLILSTTPAPTLILPPKPPNRRGRGAVAITARDHPRRPSRHSHDITVPDSTDNFLRSPLSGRKTEGTARAYRSM